MLHDLMLKYTQNVHHKSRNAEEEQLLIKQWLSLKLASFSVVDLMQLNVSIDP